MDTKGSLNYDLDSSTGIIAILTAIRNSNISTAEKNSLRDLIFTFTNGGKDEVVRNALETKLSVYKIIVPKTKNEEREKSGSKLGIARRAPISFSVKKKYSEAEVKRTERKVEELKTDLKNTQVVKEIISEDKKSEVREEERVEEISEKKSEEKESLKAEKLEKLEGEEKKETKSEDELQQAIRRAEAEMAKLLALKEELNSKTKVSQVEEVSIPFSEAKEQRGVEEEILLENKVKEALDKKAEFEVSKENQKQAASPEKRDEFKPVLEVKEDLLLDEVEVVSQVVSSPVSVDVKEELVSSQKPTQSKLVQDPVFSNSRDSQVQSQPQPQTPKSPLNSQPEVVVGVQPQTPAPVSKPVTAVKAPLPSTQTPQFQPQTQARPLQQSSPSRPALNQSVSKPQSQTPQVIKPVPQIQKTEEKVAEVQDIKSEINHNYLNRIKEIKNVINSKVGNPVNLIDIDNVAGREYMNALLEAMKKVNGGLAGEIDIAMQKLESSFTVIKKAIEKKEEKDKAEVDELENVLASLDNKSSTSLSGVANQPQTPKSPLNSQPEVVVGVQPQTPAPVSKPVTAVKAPLPSTQTPKFQPQPQASVQPQSAVEHQFNAQVIKRTDKTTTQTSQPQKVKINAGVIGVTPQTQTHLQSQGQSLEKTENQKSYGQTSNSGFGNVTTATGGLSQSPVSTPTPEPVFVPTSTSTSNSSSLNIPKPVAVVDPMRKVDLGGSTSLAEKTDEKVSGFENNSDLISAALGESDFSTIDTLAQQTSTPIPVPESVSSSGASYLDKVSSIATEKKILTIDDIPETNIVSDEETTRPLYTAEIDQGLDQLLSDWSLFKKSGLFGTGPKGREHPLFKKIAGLQIPLLLAGRFDGVTQEIRQSITDYMNGWRYEQGIVYEQGETFEIYLRRVIKHIIDLQKRRRGA